MFEAITDGCGTLDDLTRFAAGELPPEQSAVIARHLVDCNLCRGEVDRITDDAELRRLHRMHFERQTGRTPRTPLHNLHNQLYGIASPSDRDSKSVSNGSDRYEEFTPTTLGRFNLKERLGAGGFGVVYLADDTQLNRQVALKIPRSGTLADPEAHERFQREVRAAAGLHHPQIVAVYDAGQIDNVYYLAAAYCPGITLHGWLRDRRNPASPREGALIVMALAEAAHHAHVNGVLHRDIKPQNVLLDPTTQYRDLPFCPKLTDFSVAKLLEQEADVTATNVLIGTPRYMAPEQAAGRRDQIGPACDVYALGVVLYELLTGMPPIAGDDNADTLRRVLTDEPQSLRKHVAAVPRDLEAICLKCLEKSPHSRYPTAQALVDDLERFAANRPTLARPIGMPERISRWIRKRPTTSGLIAAIVIGLEFIFSGLVAYNSKLNQFNSSLGKANFELERALDNAQRAENRTQDQLYVADMRLAARAREDGDARVVSELLRRHIPRAGDIDRRGIEWWYLWNLIEVNPQIIASTGAAAYQIRLSPDGSRLAIGGKDAVVRIYEIETRKLEQSIATGQVEVNGVSFSPDGKRLASAGDDGTVRVWDLADGAEILRIQAHDRLAYQSLFTHDGETIISCGRDPVVRQWNARTGKALETFVGHDVAVEHLAVSRDGKLLASAGNKGRLWIWDLTTNKSLVQVSNIYISPFSGTDFSPGAEWFATGELSRHLRVFKTSTGREVAVATQLDDIHCLAITPDGRFIATGDEAGVVCLWETHQFAAVLADDGATRIEMKPSRQWKAHHGKVHSIVFTNDGTRALTGGADGNVHSWSVAGLAAPNLVASKLHRFSAPRFSSDGRFYAIRSDDSGVITWDLSKPIDLDRWRKLPCPDQLLETTRDGNRLAFLDQSQNIEIWSFSPLERTHRWAFAGKETLRRICLSPSGKLVASCNNRSPAQVRVFHAETGQLVTSVPVPASFDGMDISADDRRLALSVEQEATILDMETGEQIRFRANHGTVINIRFSPDGRILATWGHDRIIRLWNSRDGTMLGALSGHRDTVRELAFTSDCRSMISAGEDGVIKVWSVDAREELFDLHRDPTKRFVELRLSNDNRRLAFTSSYGQLFLLDIGEAGKR